MEPSKLYEAFLGKVVGILPSKGGGKIVLLRDCGRTMTFNRVPAGLYDALAGLHRQGSYALVTCQVCETEAGRTAYEPIGVAPWDPGKYLTAEEG